MIFDKIKNFEMYLPLHPKFIFVKRFLDENILDNLTPGKVELGGNCYANVDEYLTKNLDYGFIEAHKKFIDVQVMVKGSERFGFCNIEKCSVKEFHKKNDLIILDGTPEFIDLNENYFIILFPHDAHMPQIMTGGNSGKVKKIVFKIPVK